MLISIFLITHSEQLRNLGLTRIKSHIKAESDNKLHDYNDLLLCEKDYNVSH